MIRSSDGEIIMVGGTDDEQSGRYWKLAVSLFVGCAEKGYAVLQHSPSGS